MRILVAGAGAVGGYAAARMLEAGADVTLLVRENRRRQLERDGLAVISPLGDYAGVPKLISAGEAGEPYDLIVIAMKAYGLENALRDLRPYVGAQTVLLPFLNGFRHMDEIAAAFPGQPLLGGVARIESTLDESGRIVHFAPYHSYTYGRVEGMTDERYAALQAKLSSIPLLREHEDIVRDLWEKYLFITVMSGLTTLFDASAGEIRDVPDGMSWFERLFAETAETIRAAGGRLSDGIETRQLQVVAGMSAGSTTSMLRDLRQGLPTEAAHIHGYLLEQARRHGVRVPLLETVFQRLAIYESKRRTPSLEKM
ncbi:2-dehydropantoate 2-reductase [Cohnella sp. CFH 77786]|uniref:ketopantoate reductase family protein n=1 Tax=Cohnella sp. CFH 77786 TaxID=2662265 RepID=UPI001C60D510|nr:ketopantoate reductase family protein [Cohnella sp. CFH 77786]MBW5446006.1 2-dehydropantoate 2-reductase [Cohnella sp. CFH 77786]